MKKLHLMAAHFAAFQARLLTGSYEVREAPDTAKIAETIDKIGSAFDEYKKANDERLEQIAKKGAADPVTEAKLTKIDGALDELSEVKKRLEAVETRAARPGAMDGHGKPVSKADAEYKSAFVNWMRSPGDPQAQMNLKAAGAALETRAAQVITSTGSAGGFALPEEIERAIARLTVDISPIRQIATVRTISTSDYKELFDVGGAAAEWVAENGTRSQTNTPDLAEITPTMGTLSARPRATEESLDDLFFDVEGWLATSVAEAHAAAEGAAFVAGNGTNRPTGILSGPTPVTTADASRAFGTLQYVASAQAAAMPTTPDVFYDLVYALRARYRTNARWLTSKAVLSALRKYREGSGTGQYLWQPALSMGQSETFLGYPITEAEDMPAVGAGTFPLAFGDFREGYLIVDRVGTRVTRDDITLPGFVQWYIRKRVGGRLRNTQAIKLLKIAAS
jgi:HK97 family phage major capsid protein